MNNKSIILIIMFLSIADLAQASTLTERTAAYSKYRNADGSYTLILGETNVWNGSEYRPMDELTKIVSLSYSGGQITINSSYFRRTYDIMISVNNVEYRLPSYAKASGINNTLQATDRLSSWKFDLNLSGIPAAVRGNINYLKLVENSSSGDPHGLDIFYNDLVESGFNVSRSGTNVTISNLGSGKSSIILDPVITLNETNKGNVGDSYVSSALNQGDTNYGTATALLIKALKLSSARTFTLWNLSVVPAGSTITNANLSLYMYTAPTLSRTYNASNTSLLICLDNIEGCMPEQYLPWDELTITWNNQPMENVTLQQAISSGTTSGVWLSWSVTNAAVSSFAQANKNMSIMIKDSLETGLTSYSAYFYSKEYTTDTTKRPKLVITYTTPGPSFNPTILITQNAPADSSTNASRTINYTYTPAWYDSAVKNCSIWDNSTGSWALLKSNMSTTLTNNTLTNITWTYSQDYSVLKWAVQCCNSTNSCNMTANRTLRIDTTPPVTTATAKKNDSSTYTFNTWTNSTYVNVTLICDDTGGSGCSTTKYCNDTTNTCTPSTTYSSPVRITTQGTSYIRYNSTDSAGNIEAIKNQTIMIDSTAPVTTATAVKNDSSSYIFGTATNSSYVNVTLSCSDGETGCNITKYCTDTNNTCTPSTTYSSPVQISTQGISYIRYNSTDNLGNNEAIKSKTIIIDSTPPIYSSNSTNSTFAATPVIHSLYWQDNTNLSGYIFSFDNCTGTLVNSSWVAMTGTGNWSNVTKTINSTVGCKIQWCVYANDTSNNWNSTSCSSPFSYNTTNATSLSICSNLNQSGATYDLIADIIDSNALACMNISANNVTLDCHGHTIDSDGTNGQYGVYVYRTTATNTNATVRNCVLTDWVTDDVYLYYSSKNSLYNNAVSTNNKYGFLLASSSSNNSLYNNTVSGSSHAIALYSSSKNNLIYNNTVNSNNIAFDITSNSNLIYNNIVSDNNYPVYLNSNTNNSVYNNTVSANDHGIYLYNSSSNSVYNNTVSNNDNYGIAISSGANNSIYNNLLSNSVNVNLGGITYLNFWNTTNRSGTRIYSNGTNIGGNYWTNSSGNGYSDTCTDANKDGFCDAAYDLCSGTCGTNNTDYLPLSNKYVEAVPPVYSQNSTNSTLIKTPVEHRLYWQSNVAGLSGYIFRFDNCTGILVDSPWMQMTGTDNWTNVTLTINSTVGCIIRWCVKANDTSNKWNSTSCDLPFNYTTTVIQVPSNCSMTAIPFLTALSEPVDINVSYTNAADGSPITDAVCPVVINLDQYNPLHTTYNSTTLSYTLTTNQFLPGPNILNVTCNSTAFFDCNTSATHNVSWSGVIDFPSIIIQDPIYAVNSSGQYHKIIKKAPPYPSGNLVTDIGFGNSAYNWTYGMVTKPANSKPTCADINNIVDSSKILLVNDSSNIANVTLCPGITAFSGLIFADDACVKNATDCRDKLTVPYILNFTYNTTYGAPNLNNVNIFNLSNLTYVLLNGDQHVVQDVSGLRAFYFNGYYIESKLAPSFLMRLYGQFGPSPYGIYSFVDMNQYPSPNSSVDYYYFNKTSNIPSYLIKGMPNCENANICNNDTIGHFRLDDSISVLNSSGTYTHITSIGAEKLIYQP